MADDLLQLEDWLGPLLAKLSSQERRILARQVGQQLRRSQAGRIAKQKAPDGSPFDPRKTPPASTTKARQQAGGIRRAMFAKLRTTKHLKAQVDGEGVTVGFLGRAARIAQVHQEGLVDQVDKDGPSYRYPVRRLLGFTQAEREQISAIILEQLSGRG